jgi:hypothetical protein
VTGSIPQAAAQDVFLFATVGRTDLRAVARDPNQKCWLVAVDLHVRRFHQYLLDHIGELDIRDEAEGKPRGDAAFDPATRTFRAFDSGAEPGTLGVTTLTPELVNGRIPVVAAKLGLVARRLREANLALAGAVIFDTRREHDDQEPIASAAVLGRWLAERFSLECGADVDRGKVAVIGVASGRESFSGTDALDRPLRREIVARIVEAIARAARNASGSVAWLALGGGPPPFKPVVEAAADLHFDGKTLDLDLQERRARADGGAALYIEPDVRAISRADALAVRFSAMRLVSVGDFWGADAMVRRAERDPIERRWIVRLRAWLGYLHGSLSWRDVAPLLQDGSSEWSQRFDARLRALHDTGDGSYPQCFRAALRAESALALGQVIDAAIWTCSLFDAVLMEFISKMPEVVEGPDPLKSEIRFAPGATVDARLTARASPQGPAPCLVSRGDNRYRVNIARQQNDLWLEVLGREPLTKLSAAIRTPQTGQQIAPYELRNMLTHRMPEAGQLAAIRSVFVEAGLWAPKKKARSFGEYVLGHGLVAEALQELGLEDPSSKAKGILTDFRRMIRNAPVR